MTAFDTNFNLRATMTQAAERAAQIGRTMRASATACSHSLAAHARQVARNVKESSKDVGHAAMNFAGAYPNVSQDSPRYETWLNPKLKYCGTLPGQTGTKLSDSGLPCWKKISFVIPASLLAISMGLPISYIKNFSLTAKHSFKRSLQFALSQSTEPKDSPADSNDYRNLFHQYFAAPLIATVMLYPLFLKNILSQYLTRTVLISFIGAPLVTPLLSAVLIAVGLKTSLAVGSQIKYQVKSYNHWATERNAQPNPNEAPKLNCLYFSFTAALASPISSLGILGLAQWYGFKDWTEEVHNYFNPPLLANPEIGYINDQKYKALRGLGIAGFTTGCVLSVFTIGHAFLDETFCVQIPQIFSWLYPLIKNGPTEASSSTLYNTSTPRPFWLVCPAKTCASVISFSSAFFIHNFYRAAWAINWVSQWPSENKTSASTLPPFSWWQHGLGSPGYISGAVFSLLTIHQWNMGTDLIAQAYGHSCTPESATASKFYPWCSISGLGYRALGGIGIAIGAALSTPAFLWFITRNFCAASLWIGSQISQGIQAVFHAAQSHIEGYRRWSTQRVTLEMPPLKNVHHCVANSLGWLIAGLPILAMAQWYAAKHTLQDIHQYLSPNTPLKDIGHITTQSDQHYRALGFIGYLSSIPLSLTPLIYAFLDETFSVQTPEQWAKLFALISARANNAHLTTTTATAGSDLEAKIGPKIQRPCPIRLTALATAYLIIPLPAFLLNILYCTNWTFNYFNTAPFKNIQLTPQETFPAYSHQEWARYFSGIPGYVIGFSLAAVVHQFVIMTDIINQSYKKVGLCWDQSADQNADQASAENSFSCGIYPSFSWPGLFSRILGFVGLIPGLVLSTPALAYFILLKASLGIRAVFQAAAVHISAYHHWATNRENDVSLSAKPELPDNQRPLLSSNGSDKHYGTEASAKSAGPVTATASPQSPALTPKKTHLCLTHMIALTLSIPSVLLMAQWYGLKYLSQDIHNTLSPSLALENTGHIQTQSWKKLFRLPSIFGYALAAPTIFPLLAFAYVHEALWIQTPKLTRWFHSLITQPNYEHTPEDPHIPHRNNFLRITAIWTAALPISATLGLVMNNAYCAYWTINKLADLPYKISLLKPENSHPEFKLREIVRYVLGSPGYLLGLGLAGLWHQWTIFSNVVQRAYGCDINSDNQLHGSFSSCKDIFAGIANYLPGVVGLAVALPISIPAFAYHAALFSCVILKKIKQTISQAISDTWSEAYQWIRSQPAVLSTAQAPTAPPKDLAQDPDQTQDLEQGPPAGVAPSELSSLKPTCSQVMQALRYITLFPVWLPAWTIGSFLTFTQATANLLFSRPDSQDLRSKKCNQHLAGFISFGYALSVIPLVAMLLPALVYKIYQHRKTLQDTLIAMVYLACSTGLMSVWKLGLKPLKSLIMGLTWINRFASIISLIGLAAGVFAGVHIHTPVSLGLCPLLGGALGMTLRTCVKHYSNFKTRFHHQTGTQTHAYDQAFKHLFDRFSAQDRLPDFNQPNTDSDSASSPPERVFPQNLCTKILRNFMQIPTGLAHQTTDKNLAKGLHNAWRAWKKDAASAGNPATALSVFVRTPLFQTNLERVRNTYSHTKPEEQAGFFARINNTLDTLTFYMGFNTQASAPSAPPQYGSEEFTTFKTEVRNRITDEAEVKMAA